MAMPTVRRLEFEQECLGEFPPPRPPRVLRRLWQGQGMARPSVWLLTGRGLQYRYEAYRRVPDAEMQFTLFSEVGESYQKLFRPFFRLVGLSGPPADRVEYQVAPWVADRLP